MAGAGNTHCGSANVRSWLEADIRREPAECPLVTRSRHCSIRSAFAVPEAVEHRSLTTLREKLIKIGAHNRVHRRFVVPLQNGQFPGMTKPSGGS